MVTNDIKSQFSQLFQLCRLRQKLGFPINVVINHSEMMIEKITEINLDTAYLQELEQIRACGRSLLTSVNIFKNRTFHIAELR